MIKKDLAFFLEEVDSMAQWRKVKFLIYSGAVYIGRKGDITLGVAKVKGRMKKAEGENDKRKYTLLYGSGTELGEFNGEIAREVYLEVERIYPNIRRKYLQRRRR